MRVSIIMLVGCSSGAAPAPNVQPVVNQEHPERPYRSDPTPAKCDPMVPVPFRIEGASFTVAIASCETGEKYDDEAAKKAGLIVQERAAQLVITRPGNERRRTIETWTDGWEWGSSVQLLGVLPAPSGGTDALVVNLSGYSTDVSAERNTVYSFGDDWTKVEEIPKDLTASVKDGKLLLQTCEGTGNDRKCTRKALLTWNGRALLP